MINVINSLYDFGFVNNNEQKAQLASMTPRQLILDFILPKVVEIGGQDTRGWRLSPSFMKLMTLHAGDFLEEDRELGEMLFELALQRIQRHPNLKSIDYRGILPEAYRKYSAAYDQPGLWGEEEWQFMRMWMTDGLKLSEEKYVRHCRALILEILTASCPSYSSWFGMGTVVEPGEVFDWGVSSALQFATIDDVSDILLTNGSWRTYKAFYQKFIGGIDLARFLSHIDLDEECYYKGFKRFILKLFGGYRKATEDRIVEELGKKQS